MKAVAVDQAETEGWYKPNLFEGLCHCRCGQKTSPAQSTNKKKGTLAGCSQRYVMGHATRGRIGEQSGKWKSGRIKRNGYWAVKRDNHPAKNDHGYVWEHRVIMEEVIGRHLYSGETVHHKNGIKTDNRYENLELRQGNHGTGATHCWSCGVSLTPSIGVGV